MEPCEVIELTVELTVPGERWEGLAYFVPPERKDKWEEWCSKVTAALMPSVIQLVPYQADFTVKTNGVYRRLKGPEATAMTAHLAKVAAGDRPAVVWTPIQRTHVRIEGGSRNGKAT